jgi:hypothetical protein
MKRHKPDLLLVLVIMFGLGLAASAYTHANREDKTSAVTAAIIARP